MFEENVREIKAYAANGGVSSLALAGPADRYQPSAARAAVPALPWILHRKQLRARDLKSAASTTKYRAGAFIVNGEITAQVRPMISPERGKILTILTFVAAEAGDPVPHCPASPEFEPCDLT